MCCLWLVGAVGTLLGAGVLCGFGRVSVFRPELCVCVWNVHAWGSGVPSQRCLKRVCLRELDAGWAWLPLSEGRGLVCMCRP